MRTFITILCTSALWLHAAQAGTLVGTVRAQGKAGAEEKTGGGGGYESKKFKFADRINYSELRDFVVFLEGPVGAKPEPPKTPLQVVVQKDAQFSPHILPIVVGTTIEWPNHDEIYHNAFSWSDPKKFDLGLYKDIAKKVVFDKPGRVDVFCSIHSAMHCIVLVLENPFFAATDGRGRYSIANVPAGTYKLTAWHERLPSQSQTVTVTETGEVKTDFTLGITGLPQY